MKKKWISVLLAVVLLFQVLSPIGALAKMLPSIRALRFHSRQAPNITDREAVPTDAVSIFVLPFDYDLPAPLMTALNCKSASFEQAFAGDFDVLLVSKEKLFQLNKSRLGKKQILKWLSQGKVLLVMNTSTGDLKDILHIDMPIMSVTTTQYLVSGVLKLSDSVFASGGVLLPKSQKRSVQKEARDIQAYVSSLVSIKKQVVRATTKQSSNWQFAGVLSHYLDLCPFGKYNETVYAEQATNDGSQSYDFWNAQIDQQTIGGYSACGSSFQTSRVWTRADAGMYWGQLLYRYGPTTTNANNIAYVNIGLTAGYKGAAVSLGKSWAFSLPDVYVIDHSDFSTQRAEWEFVYSHGSNSAKYTYLSEPGVSVRTAEGYRLSLYRPINTYWWRHWWEGEYHLFDDWDLHF